MRDLAGFIVTVIAGMIDPIQWVVFLFVGLISRSKILCLALALICGVALRIAVIRLSAPLQTYLSPISQLPFVISTVLGCFLVYWVKKRRQRNKEAEVEESTTL
jgi:hypothetical protein